MRQFLAFILVLALCGGAFAQDAIVENGYVLQTAGRLLFIDKGEQDNVRPGDLFQLVRQEVIRHPETGENLAGEMVLGAVRVVEVFPRLSTAEVVNLVKGTDLEILDRESRLGIIRIKPLLPEEEMAIMQRLQTQQQKNLLIEDEAEAARLNPDGQVRKLSFEAGVGFGSRVDIGLPDRTYQLMSPTTRLGDHLVGSGVTQSDSAFANVAKIPLLTLADTSLVPQDLVLGSAIQPHIGLTYPLSERLTALFWASFGSRSELSAGLRFYPGRLLGFLGEGNTPDGRVGEPVLSLRVGRGGQGPTSLSEATRAQLTARSTLLADPVYKATLNAAQKAGADTLYRADVTRLLHQAVKDTLSQLTKRSMGGALSLTLPIARNVVLRGFLTHLGNIKETGGGLTYFMRAMADEPLTNPDGVPRSLVIQMGGRYDWGTKLKTIDFGMVMPVNARFTVSGNVVSDLSHYTRAGIVIKSYLKGL